MDDNISLKEYDEEHLKLFQKYIPFAKKIAGKLTKVYDSHSSILSDCLFGLYKASKTFDNQRSVDFSSYANRVIINECYTSFRKVKKIIDSEINFDIDDNQLIRDILVDNQDLNKYIIRKQDCFNREIVILKELKKEIERNGFYHNRIKVLSIYLQNPSLKHKEIAEKLEFTHEYISRTILSFRERIKISYKGLEE